MMHEVKSNKTNIVNGPLNGLADYGPQVYGKYKLPCEKISWIAYFMFKNTQLHQICTNLTSFFSMTSRSLLRLKG